MENRDKRNIREIVVYIIFGVLTTLVNLVAVQVLEHFLLPRWGEHSYLFSKIVAFFCALAFAFPVNKLFVFRQKSWKGRSVVRELLQFSAARVVSFLFVEYLAVFVAFDLIWPRMETWFTAWWPGIWPAQLPEITPMGAYRFITQWCIVQVIVVVVNYIFSKFIIFKSPAAAADESIIKEEEQPS